MEDKALSTTDPPQVKSMEDNPGKILSPEQLGSTTQNGISYAGKVKHL